MLEFPFRKPRDQGTGMGEGYCSLTEFQAFQLGGKGLAREYGLLFLGLNESQ